MKYKSVCLYGGAFAPPHYGHINAVRTVLDELHPSKVIVMPFYSCPHKDGEMFGSPDVRLMMCHAAFDGIDGVEVSSYEAERKGISYTADTLLHLSESAEKLLYLVGGDTFHKLGTFVRADEIFSHAEIVCVPRSNEEITGLIKKKAEYEEKFSADARIIGTNPTELSSTEIRKTIKSGGETRGLIPEKVEEIIRKERLYL